MLPPPPQKKKILRIECLKLAKNAPDASFNIDNSYGSKMTFHRTLLQSCRQEYKMITR